MSLAKASIFTAASTLIKILIGLIVGKLMAVEFGPEGVGLAGNYRQVITVLGVLAGAGIFNGVTKYIAEFEAKEDNVAVKRLLGTASLMVLVFSITIGVLFILFANKISLILFGEETYANIITILAVMQFAIAYSNLLLAILKGYRDSLSNALSIIVGAILALFGFIILQYILGYTGALIGLGLLPATTLLPAIFILFRRKVIHWSLFIPVWDARFVKLLGKFTIMTLMTAATMPLAYYLLRGQISSYYGFDFFNVIFPSTQQTQIGPQITAIVSKMHHDLFKHQASFQVGLWQSVSMISDAYLQFITAAFSVYLLPTFSRIDDNRLLIKEVFKSFKFVLPAVILLSFTVWLLRDFVIWLLFSDEFIAMRDLFSWQLIGDVLKVACYVFGYLIIAKARLSLYFLAEIAQFSLLILFSFMLIPKQGTLGASQAYMLTYMGYFIMCMIGFLVYIYKVKRNIAK